MTKKLKEHIEKHEKLLATLNKTKEGYAAVQRKAGQQTYSVSVAGVVFPVTRQVGNTGWIPEVNRGCEELQAAAEKIMKAEVKRVEALVEGSAFRMVQLAREAA
jgi:hypothetical protein